MDGERPAHSEWCHSWLYKKADWESQGKPVSSVPPLPLETSSVFRFMLCLCSCLVFLRRWITMQKYKPNKLFPPPNSMVLVFCHSNSNPKILWNVHMQICTHTKYINVIRNKVIKILNKIQFNVTQFNLSGRLQSKRE